MVYNILFYSIGNPFIMIFFVYKGLWILAVIWILPTYFGLGILFSGNNFITWIGNKLINFKSWIKK